MQKSACEPVTLATKLVWASLNQRSDGYLRLGPIIFSHQTSRPLLSFSRSKAARPPIAMLARQWAYFLLPCMMAVYTSGFTQPLGALRAISGHGASICPQRIHLRHDATRGPRASVSREQDLVDNFSVSIFYGLILMFHIFGFLSLRLSLRL